MMVWTANLDRLENQDVLEEMGHVGQKDFLDLRVIPAWMAFLVLMVYQEKMALAVMLAQEVTRVSVVKRENQQMLQTH